ncbi:uncharacterized protein PAC_19071 [Phialocephala subalpina]|uniref:Uncharacterized protein n=1 Tax=Phialocephala subalpina TaxID=576137 RepID=A0A1L7XVV5_9HELO|nr:uncharacterized protein PAC_19071 [Phialocephala subalpina]
MSHRNAIRGRRCDVPKPKDDVLKPEYDVLLLAFKHTDIGGLKGEREAVNKAFSLKGFTPKEFNMAMDKPWDGLQTELTEFLSKPGKNRIIYYHGHGGYTHGNGLEFCSHNLPSNVGTMQKDMRTLLDACRDMNFTRDDLVKMAEGEKYNCYKKPSTLLWQDISNLIMNAQCNVLTILDCCSAGGGGTSLDSGLDKTVENSTKGEGVTYTKELIAATSWKTKTYNKMSKALCKALSQWEDETISANRLQLDMTEILRLEAKEKEKKSHKMQEEFDKRHKKVEEDSEKLKKAMTELDEKEEKFKKKDAEMKGDIQGLEAATEKTNQSEQNFKRDKRKLEERERLNGERKGPVEERKKLEGEREKLNRKRERLDRKRENLIEERERLDGERERLDGEREWLNGEREKLAEERKGLIERREELNEKSTILLKRKADLKKEVDTYKQPTWHRFHLSVKGEVRQFQLVRK